MDKPDGYWGRVDGLEIVSGIGASGLLAGIGIRDRDRIPGLQRPVEKGAVGGIVAQNLAVLARWLERPYLFVFPVIGAIAAAVAVFAVRRRRDAVPFAAVLVIFAAAFGTLAISFWPYMVPFSITIAEAAAPHSSLAFMFWGAGLFIFPLMLVYTVVNYAVFRGKLRSTESHY